MKVCVRLESLDLLANLLVSHNAVEELCKDACPTVLEVAGCIKFDAGSLI